MWGTSIYSTYIADQREEELKKVKKELRALKSDYQLMAEALMSAMAELEKCTCLYQVSEDLRGER